MQLAALLRECRGPLTADFHRFYGLSFSRVREWGIPLYEVAAMAVYLPVESATARSLDPHWRRSNELEVLRGVEMNTRILAWQATRDGQAGRNAPEPIRFPWDPALEGEMRGTALEWDEMMAIIGWEDLKQLG